MIETVFVEGPPRIALDLAGSGPLVLFLHGIGGNRTNWRGNLPALADSFTAAAWDARGYGDSADFDGPFRFSDTVRDLVGVLDHLGVDTAHLVGLSLGGRIAAHFHAAHPERVTSLTLCDTHLGFGRLTEDQRRTFISSRRDPLLAGTTPADLAPALTRSLIGDPQDEVTFRRLVASLSAIHRESYIKTVDGSVQDDMAPLLDAVDVPTLVVVGERDTLTPPSLARKIAERISGSRLEIIEGAGHLPNIEREAAFNTALGSFLRGLTR